MSSGKTCRPVPGLSREAEEKELEKIIGIAQENLTKTEAYIRQLTDELDDLMGRKIRKCGCSFIIRIPRSRSISARCGGARRRGASRILEGLILKIQNSRRQSRTMWGGSALRIRMRSRL